MQSLRERIYAQLAPDPETGCLLWTGRIGGDGYGRIGRNGRVHRVLWELEYGPIPSGLELDHVQVLGCRYKHCANIAHLEAVTHHENVQRGWWANKTHCKYGHIYTEANTYRDSRGRRCRACRQAYMAAWKARARAVSS